MEENKKSARRFLAIYCVAIFIFAVGLILIASLSQQRIEREADVIQKRLSSAEVLATNTGNKLDAVMKENFELNEKIKELEGLSETNEQLKSERDSFAAQKADADMRLLATQKLSELMYMKLVNDTESFPTALEEFENLKYPSFLSPADLEKYNYIKSMKESEENA